MPERDPLQTNVANLAKLMNLDHDASVWSEADLASMLRDKLDAPVPADGDHAGQTLRALLTDPSPSAEALRLAKESAKSARIGKETSMPAEVATVLYYAAIAAARVRLGESITDLSDEVLRAGLQWSLLRPWVEEPVRSLLQQALDMSA